MLGHFSASTRYPKSVESEPFLQRFSQAEYNVC